MPPKDVKKRPKMASKPVMTMTGSPTGGYNPPFEPIDPGTLNGDGTSIVDVSMNLGSILFASAEAAPLKRNEKIGETARGTNNPTQEPIGYGKVLADLLVEEDAHWFRNRRRGSPH